VAAAAEGTQRAWVVIAKAAARDIPPVVSLRAAVGRQGDAPSGDDVGREALIKNRGKDGARYDFLWKVLTQESTI
jgi:hypothetical protein